MAGMIHIQKGGWRRSTIFNYTKNYDESDCFPTWLRLFAFPMESSSSSSKPIGCKIAWYLLETLKP
jgi:hypothetical protein